METDNPFFKQPIKERNKFVDVLQGIVVGMFIIIILYLFVFTPNQVSGPSMNTTFLDNQLVLVNRIPQWLGDSEFGRNIGLDYNRGDVVIFSKPDFNNGKDVIKRIIAVAGDTVSICNEQVLINTKIADEPYLDPEIRTLSDSYATNCSEILIEEGKYFLMGDNRTQSTDSRNSFVKQIDRTDLKGKVILTYWPISDLKIINSEPAI